MAVHPLSTLIRLFLVYLLVFSVTATQSKTPCLHPKVRREWRQLSKPEKDDWIRAINCLATFPHDRKLKTAFPLNVSQIPPVSGNSTFYDDIVYIHMDLNVIVHYTGLFLPWHRHYVQFFEDSLVQKCGYKGVQPYWDWTIDAHDFYNATIWDNSPSGLGRWGDPAKDHQINTGGFKDQIRAYPSPHHIRRNHSLFPFTNPVFGPAVDGLTGFMANITLTPENAASMIDGFDGDFIGFQTYLEGIFGPHGGPHLMVSGDLGGLCPFGTGPPDCFPGPKWTPNDPLFFLHHTMVDKLWYDWQRRRPMNKYAFGGGSVSAFGLVSVFDKFPAGMPPFLSYNSTIPGDGFWDNVSIWDVMDTQAGSLCYVYN